MLDLKVNSTLRLMEKSYAFLTLTCIKEGLRLPLLKNR